MAVFSSQKSHTVSLGHRKPPANKHKTQNGRKPATVQPTSVPSRTLTSEDRKKGKTISRSRNRTRKQAIQQLLRIAEEYDLPRLRGVSAYESLQDCHDRLLFLATIASMESDKLMIRRNRKRQRVDDDREGWWITKRTDNFGNTVKEPNKWAKLETEYRKEIVRIAEMMEKLGLAERQVRVAERVAGTIAPLLEGLEQDLQLTPDQTALLPAVIHTRLLKMEGQVSREQDRESGNFKKPRQLEEVN